ncbi:hypothetical protein RAC89_20585 [Paenibacillus sp. GD4]|jgi:hypothetical protein|uniref:hypothetical protein n=1 Tax=Paenibacillus sp. GD4 TaxID=3068890 RepID=UPI002796B073|nr:hypothetical protein [Paenibacillus sp. GD4]MDQ1912792.1 hypothetical protein [Paenibacillus sp. GD4]
MSYVEHINLANDHGHVYCCLRNKIVTLSDEQIDRFCSGCMMNRGFTPGFSVHCYWKDARVLESPHIVQDPGSEYAGMQRRKTNAPRR